MASISSSLTKSITQSKNNPCGTETCHYEKLIVHQVKMIRKDQNEENWRHSGAIKNIVKSTFCKLKF